MRTHMEETRDMVIAIEHLAASISRLAETLEPRVWYSTSSMPPLPHPDGSPRFLEILWRFVKTYERINRDPQEL